MIWSNCMLPGTQVHVPKAWKACFIVESLCADALFHLKWIFLHVIRRICTLSHFYRSIWSIEVKKPSVTDAADVTDAIRRPHLQTLKPLQRPWARTPKLRFKNTIVQLYWCLWFRVTTQLECYPRVNSLLTLCFFTGQRSHSWRCVVGDLKLGVFLRSFDESSLL